MQQGRTPCFAAARRSPTSALPVAQVGGDDEHPPLPRAHVEEAAVQALDHLVGPQSHLLGLLVVVAAGGTEKTTQLRKPLGPRGQPHHAPKSHTLHPAMP